MKNFTSYNFIILICCLATVIFYSCGETFDRFMCGEPMGKQKTFIDSVNSKYGDQFTLGHMPCYIDYMKVMLKGDYEKTLIDSLEHSYSKQVNWAEFHVYDKDGKLIRGNMGSM